MVREQCDQGHSILERDGAGGALRLETVFVGRTAEMADLVAALDSVKAGRGRAVFVGGEPGIGKTSLARHASAYAREGGVEVWSCRCRDREPAPPYWPWIELLRTGAPDLAQEPLTAMLVPGARPSAPAIPGEDRFVLFDRFVSRLVEIAHERPLLLVFDDLHGADRSSLSLLQLVVQQVATAPMLILGLYRDVDIGRRHPLSTFLAEVAREVGGRRLSLRGLGTDDVRRFLQIGSGVAPTEALVEAVLRQTGGNPFFIKELVRLGADISDGTRIPQSVREVIGRRLDGLSAECDAMLSVAAVIGPEFAVGVLERVTGLPRERLLELVDESVRQRLVTEIVPASGRLGFAHVLFRDALYAELPATRRVALHRRVGEALEQLHAGNLDDHLSELAFHFKQAASGGEVAKAVAYGLRAGHRATAATAHEEAARCYESVLELLELAAERDESARCEALLCLSEAVWRGGSFQKARAVSLQAFETARVLGSPTQMARAALNVSGRGLVFGGNPDRRAVAVLEEARLATGDAEPRLSALLSAQIARELTLAEAPDTLQTLTGEAIRRARRTGDPAVVASVLKATYWPLYGVTRPEERLRVACEIIALADRVGDRALAVEGRVLAFLGYVEVGDRAAAIAELDTCTRFADRLRQRDLLWLVTLVRGCWTSGQGLLDDFERLSQEALALGQENPAALFFFGFQHCFSATLRGRFSEVEQLLLSHAGNFPPMLDSYRALLTVIYATAGRAAEARAELERFAARGLAGLPRNVLWTGVMTNLATACFLVGDAARAAELYPLLAPYAGQLLAPLAVCLGAMDRSLGQLAATMRRWHVAERHFEVALDTNRRMQQLLHLALTRADYARMLAERGDPADRGKIDRLLADSSTVLGSLGAVPLTSASRSDHDTHADGCGAPDVRASDECGFHKEGEFWSVAYRGHVARLRHRKGFDYLAQLLRSPEREFAALDLALGESSGAGASVRHAIAGDVGSALDRTAREQYRRRRAELQAELFEAERMNDTLRASSLREEAALLARHLASAIGLGGRHRPAGSAVERSRVTVTKGIRAAIRAIQRADPVLGRYLAAHVRTGHVCAYVPDLRHPVVFRPGGTSS